MRGRPTGFWGKLKQDKDCHVLEWHPLPDHSADVAACFEAILLTTQMRRRLARMAKKNDLGDVQIQRLCVLAALHDIGKCNSGFRAKAFKPSICGHVREALYLFDGGYAQKLGAAISIKELSTWGTDENTTCRLLIASICHHGRPYQIGVGQYAHLWEKRGDLDSFKGIESLLDYCRRWFPLAFASGGEPLPDAPELQHGFAGLVMLADWLGSDTSFFPFVDEPTDRMIFAREQAKLALRQIGLDPQRARAILADEPQGFARICRLPPRPIQTAVDALEPSGEGSLVVLEAETGSGKTEAALAHFVRLLGQGAVDGMYFALPTRTAATQIHRRVVEAIERAFPYPEDRPPVVLAVPGYIAVDDHIATRLPGFEVLWNDDDQALWKARGWAAENSKRYLAGAVVVGTIDQVLLSALQVSHAHMRASTLLRQLLVVDEVHASDAYMNRILERVLDRHLQAGGHALLMSATLGARARENFLARAQGKTAAIPSLATSATAPFPQVVIYSPSHKLRTVAIATDGPQKLISVDLRPLIAQAEDVVGLALDAAARHARVLILRNTVRDALTTQAALETVAVKTDRFALLFRCSELAAPHHSRFAKPDREALDRAIEDRFGKGKHTDNCVCVATQTVQQSLDLDSDLLITDLCPLDVLLQRVGRLHRHAERQRPSGFEQARVVVLTPSDRDLEKLIQRHGEARGKHGLGTVYEDLRILEASWHALEERPELMIPSMNRALVEEATHPDALAQVVSERGGLWEKHAIHVDGKTSADKGLAALNMVDWKISFDDSRCAFPEKKELDRRIQTRLGEGDRRLEFETPFRGAFGDPVRELTMPYWWAKDAAQDAEASTEPRTEGGVMVRFGGQAFIYDRWGLRPETDCRIPEEDQADA